MNNELVVQGPVGNLEFDFIPAMPLGQTDSVSLFHGGELYPENAAIALVCHPHPVHGGTKDNKVVHTLCRAFRDLGIDSVRFNFRGVGQSDGEFDEGRGEYQDLLAIMNYIEKQFPKKTHLFLAGFSFGAFVAAKAVMDAQKQFNLVALVLVAPPVFYDHFPEPESLRCNALIVQGDADELVRPEQVVRWLKGDDEGTDSINNSQNVKRLSPRLELLPEASHFFHGRLRQLKEAVQNYIRGLS